MKKVKSKYKIGEFARNLVKLRASVGFSSAYQFYHKNGGRRYFPFTFLHYLRVEKGLTLPNPWAVEYIFLGLRILPTQVEARALLLSYVRDLLGGGRIADYIINPLFGRVSKESPVFGSAKWIRRHGVHHMSEAQFMAVTANETAYWCGEAICSDNGSWTAEDMALKLELDARRTKKALDSFVRSGLAVKESSGKYSCRHKNKFFVCPGLPGMEKRLNTIKTYIDRAGGTNVLERSVTVRSDDSAMFDYKHIIAQAMDLSSSYATHDAVDNSGIFVVYTKIKKLKPF